MGGIAEIHSKIPDKVKWLSRPEARRSVIWLYLMCNVLCTLSPAPLAMFVTPQLWLILFSSTSYNAISWEFSLSTGA